MSPMRLVLSSFAITLLLCGLSATRVDAQEEGTGANPLDSPAQEELMLRLTNEIRAGSGLPPYRVNAVLQRVARLHAAEIGRHENYSHVGMDGRDAKRRVLDAGYGAGRSGLLTGENFVARGTAEEAFAWLMDDPPHARNILHPRFREIGIGAAPTTWGGWVWVMDLGYHDGLSRLPASTAPETATPFAAATDVPATQVLPDAPSAERPTAANPRPSLGPPLPAPTPLPGSQGDAGGDQAGLPSLPDLPEEVDWGRQTARAMVLLLLALFLVQAFRIAD